MKDTPGLCKRNPFHKEPGVLLESKRTGGTLNIPWEQVIFKRVRASDEVDIGT